MKADQEQVELSTQKGEAEKKRGKESQGEPET